MLKKILTRLTYANVASTLALFIALGGVSYAATGGTFILGQGNSAGATSSLRSGVNGKTLQLTNNGSGTSAIPLGLTAPAGRPPLAVNSGAKVANLNADKLDSKDSSAFQTRVTGTCPVPLAVGSVGGDGSVGCNDLGSLGREANPVFGELPGQTHLTDIGGNNAVLFLAGSGYRTTTQGEGMVRVRASLCSFLTNPCNGSTAIISWILQAYTNETLSHKTLEPVTTVLPGPLPLSSYEVGFELLEGHTDGNDKFTVAAIGLQ